MRASQKAEMIKTQNVRSPRRAVQNYYKVPLEIAISNLKIQGSMTPRVPI